MKLDTFIAEVGTFVCHLHLSDAKGLDGEGLQVGEGEIDFCKMFGALERFSPKASFIPEVWQGHKNAGEGFWIALSRLEKAFLQSQVGC